MLTGVASIFQKKTLFREHTLELVTMVALFGMCLTLPAFFLFDRSSLTQYALGIIFLQAILVAAATFLFAKSLRHLPITIAAPILVFSPLLSALLGFLFLGESLSKIQITGIVILVIGANLLESHVRSLWTPFVDAWRGKHTRYMLGAVVLYSCAVLLERRIVSPASIGGFGVPPALFLGVEHVIMAAIYLPMLFFFHDGYVSIRHGIKTAGPIILLIALLTVGYRLSGSYALSYPEGKVGLFAAIKRTSALVAVAVGGNLFREEHVTRRVVGCAVMVIGAAMILF